MRRAALIMCCCVVTLLTGGCRQSLQPTATPDPSLQIEIEGLDAPQKTGSATLIVLVRDAQAVPIEDARVDLRGDMSHAGMTPVTGTVNGGQDGRYAVPLEWTMAGDWFLDVTVTLPDGRTTTRRFELTVAPS